MLQNPEAWICKQLSVAQLTLSLDEQRLDGRSGHSYAPLLRAPRLAISALLPVFAHLEVQCWR